MLYNIPEKAERGLLEGQSANLHWCGTCDNCDIVTQAEIQIAPEESHASPSQSQPPHPHTGTKIEFSCSPFSLSSSPPEVISFGLAADHHHLDTLVRMFVGRITRGTNPPGSIRDPTD